MGEPGTSHVVSFLPEHIGQVKGTGGIETSKYPEEKKTIVMPRVVASERGTAQTFMVLKPAGVAMRGLWDPAGGSAEPPGSYKARG